jgi:cardiolipin synthase
MASLAKERLWITDPYFLAPRPVAEALMAAARDGVDVRILVPAHNNWPWVGSLSRGGYRSLLRSGVRIFEWTGAMIHAKTSVVDTSWCRIGSTNLNSVSLLGNWELDVGVLDPSLASQVHGLFLADLASSVEVLLPQRKGIPSADAEAERGRSNRRREDGASPRLRGGGKGPTGGRANLVADLVRAGTALGSALAGQRVVGPEDRAVLWTVAIALIILALGAGFFPSVAGLVLAILFGWVGLVLLIRSGVQAWRARRGEETEEVGE